MNSPGVEFQRTVQPYPSLERERKCCHCLFTSAIKLLIRLFLLVAVLRQKKACCTCKVVTALHVQHTFWLFCSLNLWHLWRSPLPSLVWSWKGPLWNSIQHFMTGLEENRTILKVSCNIACWGKNYACANYGTNLSNWSTILDVKFDNC